MKDKSNLRQFYLTLRSTYSKPDQISAATQAADIFLKHISLVPGNIIAGYYPIHSELSTLPLLDCLVSLGYHVALPVVVAKAAPLEFRLWHKNDLLESHPTFPVLQPGAQNKAVIPTHILVPLLAFDLQGHRLGYGGGFYDRTLATLRAQPSPIVAIGYGYDGQVAQQLPFVAHDEPLDKAITNTQYFSFS